MLQKTPLLLMTHALLPALSVIFFLIKLAGLTLFAKPVFEQYQIWPLSFYTFGQSTKNHSCKAYTHTPKDWAPDL